MSLKTIPYPKTGYFSKLICDYLAEDSKLASFYHRFPHLENFKDQIDEKKKSFSSSTRAALVEALEHQYQGIDTSKATQKNIEDLKSDNTFTITTGHQLNLFTGPLYFLYKIISVINLTEKLKEQYPAQNFVPIYWMATEDHDFEEIQYFNLFGKKINWERESAGAVGELSTKGLDILAKEIENKWGSSDIAKELSSIFTKAYVKHNNLANATRYLANELFKDYGLVIVDGNDSLLKKEFQPFVEKELLEHTSFSEVSKSSEALEEIGFKRQVNPREINMFYLRPGLRERIIEDSGRYLINNTDTSFSHEEIIAELHAYPERFSPNALLRPLYQEVILPNLCYIGGGGELAYWLQLKNYFQTVAVPFPMLLLRNSALLVCQKQMQKLEKLGQPMEAMFLDTYDLEVKHTQELSELPIDFTPQRKHLKEQFRNMFDMAKKTDASFLGAVAAQEKKQLKGLDNLEKRLLKAEKRKLADQLVRLITIQEVLFPKQNLQERTKNFSEFYLEYGVTLIPTLKKYLDPFKDEFSIISLD